MASIVGGSQKLILSRSKSLRLITLFLFYFTQGFPVGVFFYAIPAWMSVGGASTAEVASVVAAAGLPWSLKLVNGFIIDRYTFLPMGRRRVWIIGAQALISLSLLAGAAISPLPGDIVMLAALAFLSNAAVTFQDVGIDSLAVDIMEEDERAKAAGIMMAAQLLGIAAATSLGGLLFNGYGITVGLIGLALVPAGVMLHGIIIRERGNERRLPWTQGESHPKNRAVQVTAWMPLVRGAAKAIVVPLSILMLPIMMARSVAYGVFEAYHPELFTQGAGWGINDYTSLISTSTMVSGLVGLIIGGLVIDRIGAQRALTLAAAACAVLLFVMGFATSLWTVDWWLTAFILMFDIFAFFYVASFIPICMQLCVPAVAATQFTVYMAIGNFGRPIGAMIAAWTEGDLGMPAMMYLIAGAACAASAGALLFVRYAPNREVVAEVAEELPQGEGLPPKLD
ncbi:MFS transporter [Aurantiacibacter sp. MUD11]|uniref:MFS transporter n=1 Tax=Aurantiacibacter sp. MUD11 TaxID=3003265 RepID=UPI0022AAD31B|nr:MFS transporter [Aurantiacibacter sp. MUD11]WAT17291.1 MFS transporter [Aurantiacibacter sp. MUD11]